MPSKALIFGLSLGLVGLSAAWAGLALQACAVRAPFLPDACPGDAVTGARGELAVLDARTADLTARIAAAERELARIQCVASPPDPYGPFDRDLWQARQLGALYGCWALDSTYATRDVDTDEVITYGTWQMCFNGRGEGRQIMQGSDGSQCAGPVTAGFTAQGRLQVVEADNLACSDGGYIHRRDIACGLGGAGLQCDTLQPETGGEASLGMSKITQPL
ncbi:hypothetical protein [Tropicimonas sp. S265A]|uniref:hypothetical protein n=1 Tax=Tropicimonas sp. S265A TaxID=3415134 RepID=UPI003C7C795E